MTIDPRHLAGLLAVATHGSFNKAAAALGLSQPALSNSIAQLERRLGFRVLERTRLGSEVNEYGRILVQGAKTVEALLAQTGEELRLKRSGVTGPLRIGATPSMSLKFMPDLMAAVLARDEAVQVTVLEDLDDRLVPALRAGELDLVLGPESGATLPADLVEETLFEDSFCIGVGPTNPLARRTSISLRDLAGCPWVLPGPGSAYRRQVESMFQSAEMHWPADSVVTNSLQLVESIVTLTNRVTVVTRLQASAHNFWRMRAIPLRGAGRRSLSIKWRRAGTLSVLARHVVKSAHEIGLKCQDAERGAQRVRRPKKD
ncbi:MAG: LysR family transcriptional regulator [Vicinamibacterales bacterium]